MCWLLVIRIVILITTATVLQACSDDEVRDAARTANEARKSQAARIAEKACKRAGNMIPEARALFDRVSRAAVEGRPNHAKDMLESGLKFHASQLELQAKGALAACQAALG